MAIFAADDDAIRARCRLSSVPVSSTDTLAIISEAISWARLEFYRRLGRSRVAALMALTEVAAPTTDDEVRRALATHVEVKLVRSYLLIELPSAFMDASGDLNKRWNEEALVRERPRSEREREQLRLAEEIEQAMEILAADGSESPGDERTIFTYDGTPETAAPLPGDTLNPFTLRIPSED